MTPLLLIPIVFGAATLLSACGNNKQPEDNTRSGQLNGIDIISPPPNKLVTTPVSELPSKKLASKDIKSSTLSPSANVLTPIKGQVIQINAFKDANSYNQMLSGINLTKSDNDLIISMKDIQYTLKGVFDGNSSDTDIKKATLSKSVPGYIQLGDGQQIRFVDFLDKKAASYVYEGEVNKFQNHKDGHLALRNIKSLDDYNTLIKDPKYSLEHVPGSKNLQVTFPNGGKLTIENLYADTTGTTLSKNSLESVVIPIDEYRFKEIALSDFIGKKPVVK